MKKITIIGHRGAAGHSPENSISSFKKAIQLGAEYIELDVHLSKDEHIIVLHDTTLNRTTDVNGKIKHKYLHEIKKAKLKNLDEVVPTLEEIITKLKGKIRFNIEVKGKRPSLKVLELVKKHGVEKDVIISSDNPTGLIAIKEKDSKIKTALIYRAISPDFLTYLFAIFSKLFYPITKILLKIKAKRTKVEYVHLIRTLATKDMINMLHKEGYVVNVWTVDKQKQIKKIIQNGADGIISNYPDRIRKILTQ